ncbi:MAG: hypothetical protein AC479_05930 [miscellaneous Crenarchaeota group-6 archaeon AD8-1]|nr:MAG: hypothetical protein AC479_05930 [miscellaneous Crenarchaeota group-6 archaeon AD8-1]
MINSALLMISEEGSLEKFDLLAREIVRVLLDQDRPIRNKEVIKKIRERSGKNPELKKLLRTTPEDSFRVQITNRLQRLVEKKIVSKKTKSAKNVVYWITKSEMIKEQVNKEVFKHSLSGRRFQKVKIKTEKIVNKYRSEINKKIENRLLNFLDKLKLRDPAKRALYLAFIDELDKQYDRASEVFLVYPTDIPPPPINEEDIEDFYNTFRGRVKAWSEEFKGGKSPGVSVVFHFNPIPPNSDEEYDKLVRKAWFEAMQLDPNLPYSSEAKKILAKYDEDMKDAVYLLKKTAEGMKTDLEKARKKGLLSPTK